MEFVYIGCRLPTGLKLEVGVVTKSEPNPVTGQTFVELLYPEGEYFTHTLKGTSSQLVQPDGNGGSILLPSRLRPTHSITKIPKDFWDKWKEAHAKSWYFRSGNLFEAKDLASAQAKAMDHAKTDAPMQPMDPSKKMKVGDTVVEVSDFHGKNRE